MTIAPQGPSLIACASKGVPMSSASVRAEQSGVRVYASVDARGPLFALQVARRGWQDVETSRSLEWLYQRAAAGEFERSADFEALLVAGEVVYQSPSPAEFGAWYAANFSKRARAGAALGMTTRNLARYLNGSSRLPWSTWVALNAMGAAKCADAAVVALAVGDVDAALVALNGGG